MSRKLGAFEAFGIELEYMIVDRDTLAVRPIADHLLRDAQDRVVNQLDRGALAWSNELALHVLEIKNVLPDRTLDPLPAAFQTEVDAIDRRLAPENARLMPGGMHPWMDPARETRLWPHDQSEIYAAYDRIFSCRSHGFANLQSMHLNLPFADDDQFARLHAAVRLLLPILPALAASSPFSGGRPSGFLDTRMAAYREHQARVRSSIGAVIPDTTTGRADYEVRVLAPMYRELAGLDPDGILRHEWFNARGAIPRFDRDALEIRVIDTQECPRADLAVAALAVAAARALYDERWAGLAAQQAPPTERLRSILLDCIRDGELAAVDDRDYLRLFGFADRRTTAGKLWRHLREVAPPISSFGGELDVILERGPLARRILGAVGPDGSPARMAAVYHELCDCLAEGRMFTGLD